MPVTEYKKITSLTPVAVPVKTVKSANLISTKSVSAKPTNLISAKPASAKPAILISVAGPVKPVVTASSTYKSSYSKYDNDEYDDYDDYYDEEYSKPAFDPKKNPLYKTSMCNNILKTGYCSYEHTCLYAHSKKELKKAPEFKSNNNYYN